MAEKLLQTLLGFYVIQHMYCDYHPKILRPCKRVGSSINLSLVPSPKTEVSGQSSELFKLKMLTAICLITNLERVSGFLGPAAGSLEFKLA